jgi:sodium/hydrogen antiporter
MGRQEVPARLRQLLNAESGLNDGLALLIVLAMLAVVDAESFDIAEVLFEVAAGIGIGILVPWCAIGLEQSRFFSAYATYRPLNAFAIGLLVYTVAATGGNAFLAAFAAGITVATVGPEVRAAFHQFGELLSELLKLAALLIFGALISPQFLAAIPASGYLFALLALIAVRPLALSLSLVWSPLTWRERAAAWFGPKGFASVVFGLLILKEAEAGRMDVTRADELFHLVALCIVGSIIAHSSTDVVVARWLGRAHQQAGPTDESVV